MISGFNDSTTPPPLPVEIFKIRAGSFEPLVLMTTKGLTT